MTTSRRNTTAKPTEITAAPTRRVLLFGKSIFGLTAPYLHVEYCRIDTISFPDDYQHLGRLAGYDFVILDYSAFDQESSLILWQQDMFYKQMQDALQSGTWFVFLHYNEFCPARGPGPGGMKQDDFERCEKQQIGLRWLSRFNIRPNLAPFLIIECEVKRNEFRQYQQRWGASKNYFTHYGPPRVDLTEDTIFSIKNGEVLGFAVSVDRGRILYLPCQRDYVRTSDIKECLESLISSLVTYRTLFTREAPKWAQEPVFSSETKLASQLASLRQQARQLEEPLEVFQKTKQLAFYTGYEFEEAVPEFFRTNLGIPTRKEEKYVEDFWILDENGKDVAIGECKSHVGGLKKSDIYNLYNHREQLGLESDFPAVLVVTAHLNANSWKEKIKPIPPQEYKIAAKNNVLVVRFEDLLFAWNSILEGKLTRDELLFNLLSNHGWMEAWPNGTLKIHK